MAATTDTDWSQLPNDILYSIGDKLEFVPDRFRFRAICKSWRLIGLPIPQPPWLLLAQSEVETSGDNATPPPRGIVGLGDQVVYKLELPEAHDRRCVGSTGNWLITVGIDDAIRLLNPFSRVQFDLPPQSTLEYGVPDPNEPYTPEQFRDYLLRKVIVSITPSSSSSSNRDCIAMSIHHTRRRLGVARPGGRSWVIVETPKNVLVDIIFYKNQFYAVNMVGVLMVCDISDGLHFPKASILMDCIEFERVDYSNKLYLVEWLGELLLVIKYFVGLYPDIDDFDDNEIQPPVYRTKEFKVYQLDFTDKKWNALKSLGEHSLFLGDNTSICVSPSDYGGLVKKNCIYFTDDYTFGYRGTGTPGGYDMGVFDLEDNSIQPHYKGISTSLFSPPLWIIPTPRRSEYEEQTRSPIRGC